MLENFDTFQPKFIDIFLVLLKNMFIALDKVLFSTKEYQYFSYYWMKTYVMGTH